MNYSVVLESARDLLGRHKMLWIFGLLAALGGSGFNFTWTVGRLESEFELPLGTRVLFRQLFTSSESINSLILLAIGLGGLAFILQSFAEGALICLVDEAQSRRAVHVSAGVSAGRRYLLPILIVRGLLALPLLIIAALTAGSWLPALANFFTAPTSKRLFDLGLVARWLAGGAATILTGVVVAAVTVGATRAIVLSRLSIGSAIKHGFQLLLRHLPQYLIITVIFIVLGFILNMVFAIVLAPFMFVTVLPNLMEGRLIVEALTFDANSLSPLAFLAIGWALLLGTLVSVFTSAVWTIAYREWHSSTPDRLLDK